MQEKRAQKPRKQPPYSNTTKKNKGDLTFLGF